MIEELNHELLRLKNVLSIKKADLTIAMRDISTLKSSVLAVEFMIETVEQAISKLGEKND